MQTMKCQRVRGFPDLLPEDSYQLEALLSVILQVLHTFNVEKVCPPLLEYSDLFSRTLGASSDIVNKEMYSFQKGEEFLTLRPEGTASVARMFITQKLYKQLPLKWYYHGHMFRHERPQKGRFRQFYQVGVEYLGDSEEKADVEILSMAWLLIKKLNLEHKVTLEINSLGSWEERENYKNTLLTYLKPLKDKLSSDSQKRFAQNPLRIWDSKEKADQDIMNKAPLLHHSLSERTLKKYNRIKKDLKALDIPFKENIKLVRGLDYYNDLVFEWTSESLGAQSAFLSGGRYDKLIEDLGGPSTPAVGWALGLERLNLLCEPFQKELMQVGLLACGEKAIDKAFQLAHQLRAGGLSVYYRFSGNFSKQMKRISQRCQWALIYGEQEHNQRTIILKDLSLKGDQKKVLGDSNKKHYDNQYSVPLSHLNQELKSRFKNFKPKDR